MDASQDGPHQEQASFPNPGSCLRTSTISCTPGFWHASAEGCPPVRPRSSGPCKRHASRSKSRWGLGARPAPHVLVSEAAREVFCCGVPVCAHRLVRKQSMTKRFQQARKSGICFQRGASRSGQENVQALSECSASPTTSLSTLLQ